MPLYLAPHSAANYQAHPSFKQKGILSHTCGPLSNLYVQGLPLQTQIAYAGYAANISMFVASTNLQKRIATAEVGIELNRKRPVLLFPMPQLVMIPRVRLSGDNLDKFVEKLKDNDASASRAGGTAKVHLRKPTFDIAAKLAPKCADFVQCGADEIMPQDFHTLETLYLIAAEFLATHTYPAFMNPEAIAGVQECTRELGKLVDIKEFVRCTGTSYKALQKKVEQLQRIENNGDLEIDEEELDWPQYNFDAGHIAHAIIDEDQVHIAKPSPAPYSNNCGNISQVPGNFDGTLLPFFPAMNTSDKVTLRRLVLKHFFRILGPTLDDCKKTWINMRAAIERISSTVAGRAITHLYYCIDLALATQTRLYCIVEDGEYLGSVVLGHRYLIYDGKEFVGPSTREVLSNELNKLSSHYQAMVNIASILSVVKLKTPQPDGSDRYQDIEQGEIESSVALVTEIRRREWTKEQKDELLLQTLHVKFRETYLANTPDNLLWLIEEMTTRKDREIERNVAQYIPTNIDHLEDKLFRVLAAYGPDAPSLFNSRGSDVFRLPNLRSATDQVTIRQNTDEELPPAIHATFKPILVAYNDWKRLLKEHEIRMDFKERGAGARGMVIVAKEVVKDVMFGLCILANEGVKGTSKRKVADTDAEAMDEDGGSSKKRKVADTLEDMFDF